MELGLRNQIAMKLERGKIDFSVLWRPAEQTSTKVNAPIIKIHQAIEEIYAEADETD
jgi:uncharacterized protein YicC (UPF0701 family)